MVAQLNQIGWFIRSLRIQMRFGALSRAPLRLLRLELQGDVVECEWMARPPDPWDADLPPAVGEHNASLQALEDALAVRELLFYLLPGVDGAIFRVYRPSSHDQPELIITGTVTREEPNVKVLSLAMRAKLCGFRFWLDEGNFRDAATGEMPGFELMAVLAQHDGLSGVKSEYADHVFCSLAGSDVRHRSDWLRLLCHPDHRLQAFHGAV